MNQKIECYANNATNTCPLTPHIMPCYTHKMAIVSWPWFCDVTSPSVYNAAFWPSNGQTRGNSIIPRYSIKSSEKKQNIKHSSRASSVKIECEWHACYKKADQPGIELAIFDRESNAVAVKPCSPRTNWTELNWTLEMLSSGAIHSRRTQLTCTKLTQLGLHDADGVTKLIGCRAAVRALQFANSSSFRFVCCEHSFTLSCTTETPLSVIYM